MRPFTPRPELLETRELLTASATIATLPNLPRVTAFMAPTFDTSPNNSVYVISNVPPGEANASGLTLP